MRCASLLALFLGAAGAVGANYACALDSSGFPPPPSPPPIPTGVAETYYSTCGGYHPPVIYVTPLASNDSRYLDYVKTPAYAKYESDMAAYKKKYGYNGKEFGEVDSTTGTVTQAASDTKTNGISTSAQALTLSTNTVSASSGPTHDDPKRDLTLWFKGFQYHDALYVISPEHPPEAVAGMTDAIAGPGLGSNQYGLLIKLLKLDANAVAPAPNKLLENFETYYQNGWRITLGFEKDPSSKVLSAELDKVYANARKMLDKLENLRQQAEASPEAKLELAAVTLQTEKDYRALKERADGLREQLDRRIEFIHSTVNLLRLAPEGGFGPTFGEIDTANLQAQAARVLNELGPLAGQALWNALALDSAWLGVNLNADRGPGSEGARRLKAIEKIQDLLADARVDGLFAVTEFMRENAQANPVTLKYALDLLDKLGTRTLRPETLTAFPRLIALQSDTKLPNELSARAKMVFLDLLKVRDGQVSMEDAIGILAPLLKSSDRAMVDSVEAFLAAQTGQKLGRDPQAWLKLKEKMAAAREKPTAK